MDREVATYERDRPHQFVGRDDEECPICGHYRPEARHVAWAATELASRQTAATGVSLPRLHG